ncbi:hypothetical protein [uncultured Methylobacterium sp.]|uniref:hypothetical protein n=1 Tax=uncultured Methylobacterium sp. TaxID=157278 RepID=UPI0026274438|nr:hypothetical protein [uncultured Methylobacterium sp.]
MSDRLTASAGWNLRGLSETAVGSWGSDRTDAGTLMVKPLARALGIGRTDGAAVCI